MAYRTQLLSLLFLPQRTPVVQEPELGTTGSDDLYVFLQLIVSKVIFIGILPLL